MRIDHEFRNQACDIQPAAWRHTLQRKLSVNLNAKTQQQ
jgi:hypothetical protein